MGGEGGGEGKGIFRRYVPSQAETGQIMEIENSVKTLSYLSRALRSTVLYVYSPDHVRTCVVRTLPRPELVADRSHYLTRSIPLFGPTRCLWRHHFFLQR
jgi:hypothetical protein